MADEEQIGQDEIEKLLRQAQESDPPIASPDDSPSDEKESGASSAALDQSEIEALMQGGTPSAPASPKTAQAPKAAAATPASATAPPTAAESGPAPQSDVEVLLNQAQEALASIDGGDSLPPGIETFHFRDFVGTPASSEAASLELMKDVELDLKIELGRTHMYLEDVLRLKKGAVVTLDKLAGDPVDIFVNGRLIARGEVLVLNDNFCVRVAELIVGESACA